jgi:hypothetical protein
MEVVFNIEGMRLMQAEIARLTKQRDEILLAIQNAIDCNCLPPAVQMHLELVAERAHRCENPMGGVGFAA